MFFLNMIQLNLFINKNIVNFILLLYKLMRCFMRKRLLIVFSVLLFLLCLSVVSATDENTNSSIVAQDYDGNEFYVDLGGDDSNSGQLNSPFNSINKAVEVSKSNDNVVIHLGEGTFEGNGNVMISINKAHLSQGGSITIVGAGADKTIIKGSSAYYAFNIYADSVVTLRDLSIVDCKSVEGGAICNSGTLLVDNCIFRNNFAFNTGGAISSIENGDCKIYNSVFINNSVICNDEYENANGVVSLAINLRPGDYIITTIFDGLDIGNKVTVLPTLVTKDLNMKYMDGSNFTAQTLDSQGKALANQTVSFNVNGVFYHRITNEDGIASLRIRLMSGEYIITSYWNNFQTGNTIKISP